MSMKDMETNNEQKPNLKNAIFERILDEKVNPKPRWIFRSHEAMVWVLWAVSVLIGALAIAVSMFVISHGQYALFEATHENFVTFMMEALPYVWFVTFGTMAFAAVYNLRHTKRGYRYPVWQILASSVVLSFAGGSALQFFGFGYWVDHELGEQMPMYASQEKVDLKIWQAPEDGRLIGRVLEKNLETDDFIFEDTTGTYWAINREELPERDARLLESNKTVRVLGRVVDEDAMLFHLCGVFPWMNGPEVNSKLLGEERNMFIQNAKEHLQRLEERIESREEAQLEQSVIDTESICANIPAVKRIKGRADKNF